jgi:hypothetical protein
LASNVAPLDATVDGEASPSARQILRVQHLGVSLRLGDPESVDQCLGIGPQ